MFAKAITRAEETVRTIAFGDLGPMRTVFVLLVVLLSIQIGIVFSRVVLNLVFIALEAAVMKQQALAPSAPPVAIAAPAHAQNMVARLAA